MVSKAIKRQKWKYRKKPPRYRKPIIMEVKENLPMAREITDNGLLLTTLPKGNYEIRIIAHPEPDKRNRHSRWIVTESNGHKVGMAKNFVYNLREQGLVRIYILGERA